MVAPPLFQFQLGSPEITFYFSFLPLRLITIFFLFNFITLFNLIEFFDLV